ncbi:hypothetical protein E6C60_0881 [Paenibacillus algicola]|uniref:GP-PDE domain-containing protein n=1 Tax=Paenibacillus algicola TaxID=2565926 RepID=A0A4P8XGL3_9BACL|nr:glycerophosphodiester phosphodiesterase [Paenibacillus algicola]QCT01602.1 hypothetical protein E6C60_0881 [Paenibacillus algicola]
MKPCRIIAHTGCEATPYNSAASCEKGYKAGADVLEVDVRATKDGIPVLYHDDEPDLSRYSYDELPAAGLGSVETLETVLRLLRGKKAAFNLDLKTLPAYEAATRVITELQVWDQIYFTGLTDALAGSDAARHVIWNAPAAAPHLTDAAYEEQTLAWCQYARQSGFAGINVQYASCRTSLVRCARQHGLAVWVFTLPADQAVITKYMDMGVDAVSVMDVTYCSQLRREWLHDRLEGRLSEKI